MTQKSRSAVRVLVTIAAMIGAPVLVLLATRVLGWGPPPQRAVGPIMIAAVVAVRAVEALLDARREAWGRQLMFPHCVSCGYDLTGNETGACPECGQRFR